MTGRRALLLILLVAAVAASALLATCETTAVRDATPVADPEAPHAGGASETPFEPRDDVTGAAARETPPARRHAPRAEDRADAADAPPAAESGPQVEQQIWPEGVVPEEELGSGEASVTLHLRDRATGLPVAMTVRLWRFDVPASERFTAGDHVQATVAVQEEGTTISALPAGRYRAQIEEQRRGAADPPEFVLATTAELLLEVDRPRMFHAYLRVYDADGVELTSGTLRSSSFLRMGVFGKSPPEWAEGRRRIGAQAVGFGGGRTGGGRITRSAMHTADGFDLGVMAESTQQTSSSRRALFLAPGRNDVPCVVKSDLQDDVLFVAPSVEIARLVGHVSLPDGRRALDAGATVAATCDPIVARMANATEWRSVPIRVTVTLEGYDGLEFEWRVDDPAPAPVTLQPSR